MRKMKDLKRVVVRFKRETVVIKYEGDKCSVKYFTKKPPSAAWKRLKSSHRRTTGVFRRR